MGNINPQQVIEHLQSKWGESKCPLCNSGKWSVSDNIYELRQYNKGKLVIGKIPIVPVIPITCDNCGNTILVNAIIVKAIDPSEKETKDD
ncbi:MAG: hypothetical protein HQ562_02405 [Candidatus Marinimicrobia bacterium]|nr:hypothetical protein [Candidatus Neomarinimicrobiota bacterium]